MSKNRINETLEDPIDMKEYSIVVKKMRNFFELKGWYEVHTQNKLSILSVGRNTNTISTYNYAGEVWPLSQSVQIWLEKELLSNPDVPGVFCLSNSYINELNAFSGCQDRILPILEFEMRGNIDKVKILEIELLEYLGFGEKISFVYKDYRELDKESEEEEKMINEVGQVVFLENCPNSTEPGWNMMQNTDDGNINKIDVLLHGIETIYAIEKSTSKEDMRKQFYNVNEGNYANILFSNFTKDRVVTELDDFLRYDMVDRCGGGIEVNKIINAMKRSNISCKEVEEIVCVIEEVEKELLSSNKRTKSRCWGLPVAVKSHTATVGTLLAGAMTAGGEKAIELAIDMI